MKRPIAISLSPNVQKDDICLSIKTLLKPRKWKDLEEVNKLEKEFAARFGNKYKAIAVNSGRSAQYLILKSLGIKQGDSVAIQGFTCVVVPNSVIWTGAKPLYIDIDDSFNLNPVDLENKLTRNTKAIIVQHTFGIPADMDSINRIARRQHIPVIEDCAHSLGGDINNRKIGTLGDVAFFSFGRDKIISSVFGGMILCKNKDLYKKLLKEVEELPLPSYFWIIQQLMHPILFSIILPLYDFQIGKFLILFLQKLKLLSKAIYPEEKKGKKPPAFPKKMPGGLAVLARNQLKKLHKFNTYRMKIADYYFSKFENTSLILPRKVPAVWLRFPVRCKNAAQLFKFTQKRGILLGDWYKNVIFPVINLSSVFYKNHSCPFAENYSQTVINLPTYPNLTFGEARRVVSLIKLWLNTQPKK